MALRWYVVHAYSNLENKVKLALENKIEQEGLQEFFGKILVPTEEVVESRMGQQRKSTRKFFPGYMLVQMELTNQTWHLVKSIPKVLGFIGGVSDNPSPISDKEAQAILNRVEDGVNKPMPKVLFEIGETLRINSGPFKDFNCNIEEISYSKSLLKVSVLIFGRSTPVELGFGQVEKL